MSHRRIWLFCIIALLVLMTFMPAWAQTYNLNLIGRDPLGSANDIYVVGSYAYVCVDSALLILNIVPDTPIKVGAIEMPDTANGIFVSGSHAFVAYGDNATTRDKRGLAIVNISTPAAPWIVSTFTTPDVAKAVTVYGSKAYVCYGNFVTEVNIANIANPIAGSWPVDPNLGDTTKDISYGVGSYLNLYVANGNNGLREINPATGAVMRSFIPIGLDARSVHAMRVGTTDYALVAFGGAGGGGAMVKLSDLTVPYTYPGFANCVHGSGNYMAVGIIDAGINRGVKVIDVSTSPPTFKGGVGTFNFPKGVFVAGTGSFANVHAAVDVEGVFNIGPVSAPGLKGFYRTIGGARGVFAVSGYVYQAVQGRGFQVINASNKANPILSGSCALNGQGYDVYVKGVYAYVADGTQGLRIINVNNPASPTEVASYTSFDGGIAYGVQIIEKTVGSVMTRYAYVATGSTGLYILNVTNPLSPTFVGSRDTPSNAKSVAVEGDYAYIADGNANIISINISNPASPTLADIEAVLGNANDIAVSGFYAYVATDLGLCIVDVQDPNNIIFRYWTTLNYFFDTSTTHGPVNSVFVAGNYAYLAGLGGCLHVINVSNPAAPFRVKLDESPEATYSIYVDGIYAYLTDMTSGLYVYAANTRVIIATAGSDGRISPSGAVQVGFGQSQRFTIKPDRGFQIKDVKVDGKSVGKVAEYTFTNVTSDRTIHATFEDARFIITATAGPNGIISPSGTITKKYREDATFTFIPITGYKVLQVTVNNQIVIPQDNSYTIRDIRSDHTINVTFEPTKLTITATAEANGKITPSGQVIVNYGSNQAFTIAADAGFNILDVVVDGVSVGAVSSYPFANVTADHTISATFAPIRNILATAGPGGAISPFGTVQVADGGSKKFTMTANTGYQVADVKVNGTSVGAVTEYTFTNVRSNQTIEVSFVIKTYVVTASAGTGGTITPSGPVTVTHGASQSFIIAADVGYSIADVKVDGTSVGAVSSYTISNITGNRTIEAIFAINKYDITASAGAGGSISPSGVVKVNHGSNQTFTITPAEGYNIGDVKVDGVSVGAVATYTFTNVIAPHTISATFNIKTFKITATASGNGTGTITPAGDTTVNYGGAQTYTITPAEGSYLQDLIVDGNSVGIMNSYTFANVKGNRTINAVFALNVYILRSSSVGKGIVTPSGETKANHGQSVTFTITPDPGYFASIVKVDGVIVEGVTDTYTFSNITKNHAIIVTFSLKSYKITSSAGANGSISPLGEVTVNHGGSQQYNIAPSAGYHVADVVVDGASVGTVGSYVFTNVADNHKISATFEINTYKITATAGDNGTITPVGEVTLNYGGEQEYIIAANANYYIADVKVDGKSVGAVSSYKFTGVSANRTITATFAINTYKITASAGVNGTISPTGTVTVNYGGNQVFNMIPMVGFQVTDILVDGVSVGAANSYTFTSVDANHTISVTFGMSSYTITASVEGPGTITPSGVIKVNHAGMKIFTIKPNDGARLVDVKIDGRSMGPLLSYQFSVIVANHTIVAIFEQKNADADVLMQNFPNPFNPETWIPFSLKNNGEVKISIYDSVGRLVRELNLGHKNAGIYSTPDKAAYWDGKDQFGTPAASGVYFYRIQAGDFSAIRKMIVMK